jgi:hypothetical protein
VTLTPAPAVQDRDRLRAHQLPFQLARSARLADLLRGHWQSRHCTTSAMSPSVKTPPRSAPAPLATSWPACATWPSGCSVGQGRSTSPPRYAATPATHTDLWPRSGSASDETDVTTERQSPAVTYATNQAATKSTGPPKQPTAIFVLDEIAVTALITAQAHPARLADWIRRGSGIEALYQGHFVRRRARLAGPCGGPVQGLGVRPVGPDQRVGPTRPCSSRSFRFW